MGVFKYIDNLYNEDPDGYIHILQLGQEGAATTYNFLPGEIKGAAVKYIGDSNVFITPNTFYIPKKGSDNIRQFRALYIDLDIYTSEYSKSEAFYNVFELSNVGKIPTPSMVIDSGQGLHLYWYIKHAPKQAAWTWQELEDYLYKQLKHLGADIKATDAARVLRLPGTINTKNDQECKIIHQSNNKYTMYDLRTAYLDYGKKAEKPVKRHTEPKKDKETGKLNHIFNSYTLHLTRAEDIRTLCELRDYEVTNYRNKILHCYIYWKGIYTRDQEDLLNIAYELNDRFTEPKKDKAVISVTKSVLKAIEKFIDYEQGIRSGEKKRVTKGMRDKAGYWYTNEKLIEMLDITPEEQKKLKTIISKEEKNRRKREQRRNAEGLTPRQQKSKDIQNQIDKLRAEGLTIKKIAEQLEMSSKAVQYYLYK